MAITIPAGTAPETLGEKAKDAHRMYDKGYSLEDTAYFTGMYPGYNTNLEYIIPKATPTINTEVPDRSFYAVGGLSGVPAEFFIRRPDLANSLTVGYTSAPLKDTYQSMLGSTTDNPVGLYFPKEQTILVNDGLQYNSDIVNHELRHAIDRALMYNNPSYMAGKYTEQPAEITANVAAGLAYAQDLDSTVAGMKEAYRYGLPKDMWEAQKAAKQGSSAGGFPVPRTLTNKVADMILDSATPESFKKTLLGSSLYYDMRAQQPVKK